MNGAEQKTLAAVRLAAGIALTAIVLLVAMIIAFALPVFIRQGTGGVFSWTWQPYSGQFGILPMITGSLALSLSALLVAWPMALCISCWSLSQRSGPLAGLVRAVIRFMTAIPTVVYGFAALFLLTPLVRNGLGGSGLCWLSAAVMLALLILPTMILVLEAGLKPRLEALCPGGLAVGFGKTELLYFFVFPHARETFLAAALLGFGRAVGDTLLPLMLSGNAPQVPESLIESLRTLTAHMAMVTANEVGGAAYNSLFTAGALLLLINATVSIIARRLGKKTAAQ